MTTKNTNQEIDLIELFSKIGNSTNNFFTKIFTNTFKLVSTLIFYLFISIKESTRFILKKWVILTIFIILGYTTSLIIIKKTTPYFETYATIQTFTISSSELIEYVNKLTALTETQDSIAIGKTLNISTSVAASIKKIYAYWLIDINNDGVADEIDFDNSFKLDSTSTKIKINNRFVVQLDVYSPEYINEIQDKFANYISSYPKLTQTIDIKRQSLISEINKIDNEIKIIDSLKRYEYFTQPKAILKIQQERAKQKQGSVALDKILFQTTPNIQQEMIPAPELLHDVVLQLYQQNIKNKAELASLTEPYIFVSKFEDVHCPVNINKTTHISAKLSFISLFLGVILSIFIDYKKDIITFINKK